MAALKRLDLDEKTLVIWTSDNGAPGRREVPHGSNLPYQGDGYNTSEGAMRMPCIVRWPGKIPAGSECRELCSMMDWLPTLASLAGAELPSAEIDGYDIRELLFAKPGASSPYHAKGFMYYQVDQLQCVRRGEWKLYLPLREKRINAAKSESDTPALLYNVVRDVAETHMVAEQYPQVVAELTRLADHARAEIGDEQQAGKGQRPAGEVPNPVARTE
jgi:arylsulfatase A-like enzyme